MTHDEVLRRTINLKKYSPAAYDRLVEQFEDMATGRDGGIYFLSYHHSNVREQYYKDWKDEDFIKLLEDLRQHDK